MAARAHVVVVGPEHPHELADHGAGSSSARDGRARGLGPRVLGDREVPRRQRGDLRQVRDADELAALGQRAQLRADRARGVPADAGVDLVEDERRPAAGRVGLRARIASMTRESSPPDAISRSGPAGTPALGAMTNSTASVPVGPGSRSASSIANVAPSMARSARRATDGGRQARRLRGARLVQRGGQARVLGPRRPPAPRWPRPARPPPLRAPRGAAGRPRRGRARPRSSRRACAAGGPGPPGAPRRPRAPRAPPRGPRRSGAARRRGRRPRWPARASARPARRGPRRPRPPRPARHRRRPAARPPRCRPRAPPPPRPPRRTPAAPRGGAGARAAPAARPPRPRRAPPRRSRPARRRAGPARARGPRRAPRARPGSARAPCARPHAAAHASRRAACSGPQASSRSASCAEASVSRRCSCWP